MSCLTKIPLSGESILMVAAELEWSAMLACRVHIISFDSSWQMLAPMVLLSVRMNRLLMALGESTKMVMLRGVGDLLLESTPQKSIL